MAAIVELAKVERFTLTDVGLGSRGPSTALAIRAWTFAIGDRPSRWDPALGIALFMFARGW